MATEFEVLARIMGDSSSAQTAFNQASQSAQGFQHQVDKTNGMLIALGVGLATVGFAVTKFAKTSFTEAARVSEMDVAMTAIGKSTGVGALKLREATKAIKDKGIEMAAAQKMAVEFAQGELDVAQAADIARVAQDLAVVSQKNSTDTATLLTRAIITGNSMLLKSAGVSRQVSEGYTAYAKELGKTTTQLTATERQQATINLILDEGTKVAGVYEAAMQEAGKVLRSFPRLLNDIHVSFGTALVDGFGPAIKAAYDLTKQFDKAIEEGGKFYPIIEALGIVLTEMISPFTEIIKHAGDFVKNFDAGTINVSKLADQLQRILPFVTALAAGLSTMAGKSLLAQVPILGQLVAGLNPVVIGFAVLIAMTPKLRDKVLALGEQVKKLIPPFLAVAKAVMLAASQFIDEFIVPIAGFLISLLAPAIDFVVDALGVFGSSTETATNFVESLKLALIILTATYVGLKVVQLASIAIAKAHAIMDGILTVATFLLILATDGLAAAFAALGVAMTASGIGAIIVIIGLIIAAMIMWYQKSVWFRNAVKQILEFVINLFVIMANAVTGVFNTISKAATGFINQFINAYNYLAKILRLPKIDPFHPLLIPTLDKINIGLEEAAGRALDLNYNMTESLRKFVNMQKAEGRARMESMGWVDEWNAKVHEQIEAENQQSSGVDKLKQKIDDLKKKTLDYVNNALTKATDELNRQKDVMRDYQKSVSDAITGQVSLSGIFASVTEAIKTQTDDLKRQQEVLDKYAESVGKAVSGTLSLSKVFDDQTKAAEAMEKANSVVADAQTSLGNEQAKHAEKVAAAQTKLNEVYAEYLDAFNSGDFKSALSLQKQVITANNQLGATEADIAEVTKAQTALGAATSAASKAQSEQITFLARLQKQADLAVGFAERIGKLSKANLSQDALDQIIAAGATTGTAIADELLAGGSVAIDKTNELFALIGETGKKVGVEVASKFYSVGELMGMDFMKALIKEADKAKLFADRVRQLAEAGLSKEALAQVLAAGADAGTAIADYLLVAGSDRITSTNNILLALQTTADQLGELLGSKFYQAGVDLAQQIVDGLTSKLAEVTKLLKDISTVEGAKNLFNKVKGEVDVVAGATTVAGTGSVAVGAEMKAVTEGRLTLEQAQALMARRYNSMPMLASGGIVSKPTVAMIGESGAEAVIPLSKLGSLGGGTSISLTVNAGMGANGASIGQEIVDQLVRWERRNGRVPITTGS